MATKSEVETAAKSLASFIVHDIFIKYELTPNETLFLLKKVTQELIVTEDDWGTIGNGVR